MEFFEDDILLIEARYKQDEVLFDCCKLGKNNTAAGINKSIKNNALEQLGASWLTLTWF